MGYPLPYCICASIHGQEYDYRINNPWRYYFALNNICDKESITMIGQTSKLTCILPISMPCRCALLSKGWQKSRKWEPSESACSNDHNHDHNEIVDIIIEVIYMDEQTNTYIFQRLITRPFTNATEYSVEHDFHLFHNDKNFART